MINIEYNLIDNWLEIEKRPLFKNEIKINNEEEAKVLLHRIIAQHQFVHKVRCGISMCRTLHSSGYLVILNDQREIIIGKDCGKKYFGMEFINQKKIINAKKAERENYEILEAYMNDYENLFNQYNNIVNKISRISFYLIDREIKNFVQGSTRITYWMHKILQREVSNSGIITRSQLKTEEEILSEKMMMNSINKFVDKYKLVVVCKIDGFEIVSKWREAVNLKLYFEKIFLDLKNKNNLHDPRKIKKIIKEMRSFRSNLIEIEYFCAKGSILLTGENVLKLEYLFKDKDDLENIKKWAIELDYMISNSN